MHDIKRNFDKFLPIVKSFLEKMPWKASEVLRCRGYCAVVSCGESWN